MSDKKYSPKEAALAVLKRASELYKESSLSKSEDLKKGDWAKIHSKLKREGYSEESADKIDGAIKAKMNKAETGHEKGVHTAIAPNVSGAVTTPSGKFMGGQSLAGQKQAFSRSGGKEEHKQVLGQMKQMTSKDKSGMGKSEDGHNPDEKADAALGEKVEQEVQQHEEKNADPAHEAPMKGHIKLAKFMGAMEQKRGTRAK